MIRRLANGPSTRDTFATFSVWTPFGSVDASAKRCEAKGHQCSPVGNTAVMFTYGVLLLP